MKTSLLPTLSAVAKIALLAVAFFVGCALITEGNVQIREYMREDHIDSGLSHQHSIRNPDMTMKSPATIR